MIQMLLSPNLNRYITSGDVTFFEESAFFPSSSVEHPLITDVLRVPFTILPEDNTPPRNPPPPLQT
jgi:hypothetical protein